MILHPKTHIDTLKHPQTPPNTARGSTTMIQDTPQPVPKKTDFLAKKVDFRPFLAIFGHFPLLSVTSFPLEKGHNDRWSGPEYSREPLETFILSFTRLILALEPRKWIFSPKRSILGHFWPFPLLSVTFRDFVYVKRRS